MYGIIVLVVIIVIATSLRKSSPNRSGLSFHYASFGERFIADIVDGLLALIISLPFWFLIDKLILDVDFFEIWNEESDDFGVTNFIFIILFLYNMTYLVGKCGQSWGRKLYEIKAIDYSGNTIGFWKAFFRNLIALSLSTIFYLGFLWVLWDKERQAWHDKIMKTYVVVVNKDLETKA